MVILRAGVRFPSSSTCNLIKRMASSLRQLTPKHETLKMATVDPTVLRPYFHPMLSHEDFFNLKPMITIQDMFDAGVHYGHKVGTLKENMKWAIYGERLGVCLFDLNVTERYLFKALNFIAHMSYQGAIFMFVTTQRAQIMPVEKLAEELGQYSHTRYWKFGTFTNSTAIQSAHIRLPDVVIFFNTLTSVLERHPAISESARMAIPTVAIVDSNSEPNYITYPVPGNDDSISSFEYYVGLMRKAIQLGQRARESEEEEEQKSRQKREVANS